MSETETQWTPFWFEGNQYFDWVNTREDWTNLVEIYRPHCLHDDVAAWILDTAQVDGHSMKPKYGFVRECDGKETLREFFEKNDMQP